MSDYGDFCRNQRQRVQDKARKQSQLCWNCGARVWDYEPKCCRCNTENDRHKVKEKGSE